MARSLSYVFFTIPLFGVQQQDLLYFQTFYKLKNALQCSDSALTTIEQENYKQEFLEYCARNGFEEPEQEAILQDIRNDLENNLWNPLNLFSPLYQSFKSILGEHILELQKPALLKTQKRFLKQEIEILMKHCEYSETLKISKTKTKNFFTEYMENIFKEKDQKELLVFLNFLDKDDFKIYDSKYIVNQLQSRV